MTVSFHISDATTKVLKLQCTELNPGGPAPDVTSHQSSALLKVSQGHFICNDIILSLYNTDDLQVQHLGSLKRRHIKPTVCVDAVERFP